MHRLGLLLALSLFAIAGCRSGSGFDGFKCDTHSDCAVLSNWPDTSGMCMDGQCVQADSHNVCGDGFLWREDCDDGNLNDSDGCDTICNVETGWNCPREQFVLDAGDSLCRRPCTPESAFDGACGGDFISCDDDFCAQFGPYQYPDAYPFSKAPLVCSSHTTSLGEPVWTQCLLEDIENSFYINGWIDSDAGDVSELSSLAERTHIDGHLIIRITETGYGGSATLALPLLESVGGRLSILCDVAVNSGVCETISLPALRSVGENFEIIYSPNLESLSLPKLESVGADIIVSTGDQLIEFGAGASNLSSIEFAVLSTVGGNLHIDHHENMLTMTFPELASVGGYFYNDGSGADYNEDDSASIESAFPKLSSVVGDFTIEHGYTHEVSFPLLENIGGSFRSNPRSIGASLFGHYLKSLIFAELSAVGSSFEIIDYTKLEDISFPKLASVGDNFLISGNTQLPLCQITNLIEQIGGSNINGDVTVAGNGNADDTCE